MVVVDSSTLSLIEKKANFYDATKERIIFNIKSDISIAIEKLKTAEEDILAEIDDAFVVNPFRELLNKISAGAKCTNDEIETILSTEIPKEFGPSEESFQSLLGEIGSFKSWQQKKKKKRFCLDLIPKNIKLANITHESILISWDKVKEEDCFYEIELKSPTSQSAFHSLKPEYAICDLNPNTKYRIRVRTISQNSNVHIWSNPITVQTKLDCFYCEWKDCPDDISTQGKYYVDERNSRIATRANTGWKCSIIIGNETLPLNKVSAWDIKIRKSLYDNGDYILVGVAPYDINQNEADCNYNRYGWYFYCYYSTLCSGPPHKYRGKTYGPRKWFRNYVSTGSMVGVIMNTAKGNLSFSLNGVSLGVAYEYIPLDKPLVPCVILGLKGDSVEIIPRTVRNPYLPYTKI